MKTKDQIIKEMAEVEKTRQNLCTRDVHLRTQFSKVLANSSPTFNAYGGRENPKLMQWEEIFFEIGELNSDANYSVLLEEKHRVDNSIANLMREKNEREQAQTG